MILNRLQLVSQDLFSIPFDNKHVVWLLLQLNMDFLSPELICISYDILSEDLLDSLVVQDVIVWHLKWQLSKTVSLVDIPNPLIEQQFNQSGVSETACLVQRIILTLIAILFHLISVALVQWICKIFYQDQFTDLLLIIFDCEHKGRLLFLLFG